MQKEADEHSHHATICHLKDISFLVVQYKNFAGCFSIKTLSNTVVPLSAICNLNCSPVYSALSNRKVCQCKTILQECNPSKFYVKHAHGSCSLEKRRTSQIAILAPKSPCGLQTKHNMLVGTSRRLRDTIFGY